MDSLLPIWNDASKNYKLIEILGNGTFGLVVRGKHRETGQSVAIKLIQQISKSPYSMR